MTRATVTPKYINGPKGEGNYGSINCDGTYYSFDVRKIRPSEFDKGKPVTIEFTETEKGGKTYFNITRLVPQSNGNGEDHAPAASNGRQHGAERDETITRLAIAKSCIEAGQDTRTADAWIAWVKGAPSPKRPPSHEDLSPDIPF